MQEARLVLAWLIFCVLACYVKLAYLKYFKVQCIIFFKKSVNSGTQLNVLASYMKGSGLIITIFFKKKVRQKKIFCGMLSLVQD